MSGWANKKPTQKKKTKNLTKKTTKKTHLKKVHFQGFEQKKSKKMHLNQNFQQKSAFFSKLQGFEPNKREKPCKEEHFYQNSQGFKRRKMKIPKTTIKPHKKKPIIPKNTTGLGFKKTFFSHPERFCRLPWNLALVIYLRQTEI